MEIKKLILNLFDSGAAGGASAGATAPANGESAEMSESPVGYKSRRQAAAEREKMAQNAIRGRATPKAEPVKTEPEAPKEELKTEEPAAEQPKDYNAQLDEMMKDPEFRKAFSNKAQGMIDERFKKSKATEAKLEALSPVLEILQEKYGTADGDIESLVKAFSDDKDIFDAIGEKRGMSGEQFKAIQSMSSTAKRERQLRMEIESRIRTQEFAKKINAETEAVRQVYPDFNLSEALKNPQMKAMIKSGVSLKTAYEAMNIDSITAQKVAAAEHKTVENIKSRAERPVEGGASAQTGVIKQNSASRLTRQEREALAQKAIRGERVTLN